MKIGWKPGSVLGQDLVGFVGGDLADRDVPPVDLVVVGLELDRAAGRDRQRAVPVVLEDAWSTMSLSFKIDRGARADLDDPERVPLADRIVGRTRGSLPGAPGLLFQRPPEPLSAPMRSVSRLGEIPDLDLRGAAEVNAAISLRTDLEVDQQLDVAVVFVGGEIDPLAVVDDHAVFYSPMFLHVLGALGEHLGLFV